MKSSILRASLFSVSSAGCILGTSRKRQMSWTAATVGTVSRDKCGEQHERVLKKHLHYVPDFKGLKHIQFSMDLKPLMFAKRNVDQLSTQRNR